EHELFVRAEVGEWISECESEMSSDDEMWPNVRDWRFDYDRATTLPTALVTEFQETSALGKATWAEAREKADFGVFAPHLERLVELSKEKAECFGYEECPYDALLENFERGAQASKLTEVFSELRPQLVALGKEIVERGPRVADDILQGDYPIEKQQAFNQEVAEKIGFDFEAGRIDTAVHPFCSGVGPRDTRLTTRYDEAEFTSSLFGVLHEAGHGMYDQGLPEQQHCQPMGRAVSLGIHESQSRLWENHVGRSREFWQYWLPVAVKYFPHLGSISLEDMVFAVNRSSPSYIRVEADEVTYDLHIMLRFELERAIFDGKLAVKDIPGVWNERVQQMFGLEVPDDAHGCLQDIHWSMGMFGYFPTYSLGNLNASQLMAAAKKDDPQIDGQIARGDCSTILKWMREKVHHDGSRYLPGELIERATGEVTSSLAHLQHLRGRYL
ncbi:MAG: carboxypeptidase M32, partial [Verrucomicrobia bacterium]|nr:carboxypeptidase M32 [Verrucomicrobiota bacterium]